MKYPFLIEYDELINLLSEYIDTDDYIYAEINKYVFTLNDYNLIIRFSRLYDKVVTQIVIYTETDFSSLTPYNVYRVTDQLIIEEYEKREAIEYSEDNVINTLIRAMINCDPSIRNKLIDNILE